MFSTAYCLGTWGGGDLLAFILAKPWVEVTVTLPSMAVLPLHPKQVINSKSSDRFSIGLVQNGADIVVETIAAA
jgi:hypothetical protein